MRQDLSCLLSMRADIVDSLQSRSAQPASHHSYALSDQSLEARVCRLAHVHGCMKTLYKHTHTYRYSLPISAALWFFYLIHSTVTTPPRTRRHALSSGPFIPPVALLRVGPVTSYNCYNLSGSVYSLDIDITPVRRFLQTLLKTTCVERLCFLSDDPQTVRPKCADTVQPVHRHQAPASKAHWTFIPPPSITQMSGLSC